MVNSGVDSSSRLVGQVLELQLLSLETLYTSCCKACAAAPEVPIPRALPAVPTPPALQLWATWTPRDSWPGYSSALLHSCRADYPPWLYPFADAPSMDGPQRQFRSPGFPEC